MITCSLELKKKLSKHSFIYKDKNRSFCRANFPSTHTTLFWRPYDVVLTLWTLYRRQNDVVCVLRSFSWPSKEFFIFLNIFFFFTQRKISSWWSLKKNANKIIWWKQIPHRHMTPSWMKSKKSIDNLLCIHLIILNTKIYILQLKFFRVFLDSRLHDFNKIQRDDFKKY